MGFHSNLNTFHGKPVLDFSPLKGIESTKHVYRIRADYDNFFDKDPKIAYKLLEQFCHDSNVKEVEELVIGIWDYECGPSDQVVELLITHKDKLPRLKSLMLGDIIGEEIEASWIRHDNLTPLLNAFPNLLHFRVRGSEGLGFEKLNHENLQSLIIESGGLGSNIIKEIFEADLPSLEHLELWLGEENYGFDGSVDDYEDLLAGKLFPKLKYLGLCNSVIFDEIAKALINAPILDRIEVLDLSKGVLRDEGGQAILENPKMQNLKHLNLEKHYFTKEMTQKLNNFMPEKINLSEPKLKAQKGKIHYFIEVGE